MPPTLSSISRMVSSAESGAPHPVNGPRGRLPPQVSPEHVGCIHRAGGIGDCYLVMRHLPAPAGPARMGASSCPLAHPGLRPMAGHLRRTQRRSLNPSPLLDNHREGRPHSSWARPIHDLRDFSWSSLHAYWGAPDHTHRQIKSCGSGRDAQRGLCQLSAGERTAGPKVCAHFCPSLGESSYPPSPEPEVGWALTWHWWDWAPEAAVSGAASPVTSLLPAWLPPP